MERRSFIKSLLFFPFTLPFFKKSSEKERVLLLETVVAGFSYYDGEKVWQKLKENDKLVLKREPTNPYDENAIEIYWKKWKLGYVPRVDNSVISQMLDRGEKLLTTITWLKIDDDPWERIGIKIELEIS
ncbi:hypothetical protein THER_1821 [Thermodesulfovibrio sp. N1]|uniref:HIRAN domain-containing protein n=1 Tax=unclassified Thermodesulfovibrio TaxID=2645936 RepID=UPI00083B840D|nr:MULTISPECIES: HIRAN domain-containing protein [unclassified Thermodesulfovibrio]MDI1471669.1 HIRAN domain-containing protein [Thermodesulfovibrio sp. 1176]ODA43463.1 hypothetical protein THER_1821 [Thermodesulfovibrio sp. N1]